MNYTMTPLKNNTFHYVFVIQTTFSLSSLYIDWLHGNIQKLYGIISYIYKINGTFKNNE